MSPIDVKVKLLATGARAPEKAHDGDAGWDLFASEEISVPPGATRIIPTGVALSIPGGWYAQIKSRSGLGALGLVVNAGVIDSTYRGPVGVVMINTGAEEAAFSPGDRVAQVVFLPVPEVRIEVVESLDGSARGSRGFGSTGI